MALEIVFKIAELEKAVETAGYLVIDSASNIVEQGTTSIDVNGKAIIPITSEYIELGEKVRPTIDDFTGDNFDESGTATDWIEVTEVYVDFKVEQNGYTVECRNQTGTYDSWDMGDGKVLDEENPTYIYLKNGTYTITNGSFSQTVTVDNVTEFDVVVEGNKITCTRQSGFTGSWSFGDGGVDEDKDTEYTYLVNGTFEVSFGIFSKTIVIDYYSETLVESVNANKVIFSIIENSDSDYNYGDNEQDSLRTHEYNQHGKYLAEIDEERQFVNIESIGFPTPSFTVNKDINDSSLLTFVGQGGDDYEFTIDGNVYNESSVTHQFEKADNYTVSLLASFNNGNSRHISTTLEVLKNNVAPTAFITTETNTLSVTFNANVEDLNFNESHTYHWIIYKENGEIEKQLFTIEPTYVFESPEVYQDPDGQTFDIECTVTDRRGSSVTVYKTITVYDFSELGNELLINTDFTTSNVEEYILQGCTSDIDTNEGVITLTAVDGGNNRLEIIPSTPLVDGKIYVLTIDAKQGSSSTGSLFNWAGIVDDGSLSSSIKFTSEFESIEFEFTVADASAFKGRVYVNTSGSAGDTILIRSLSIKEKV